VRGSPETGRVAAKRNTGITQNKNAGTQDIAERDAVTRKTARKTRLENSKGRRDWGRAHGGRGVGRRLQLLNGNLLQKKRWIRVVVTGKSRQNRAEAAMD